MRNPLSRFASLFRRGIFGRFLGSASPALILQPDFLRGEEPLSKYRVGGYHPTNIGDVLKGRYQIHRKLGWGLHSTVWLAHDTLTDEYRSIKILTGTRSSKSNELEFLQHISTFDPTHPGYSRVIRLLDHFFHSGPYGNHLCLVTEVLCESMHSLATYAEQRNIHPAVMKSFTRQILQGLDYLHKSGIVHTDLKLDNFLVEIDDMNTHVRRTLESSSPVLHPEVTAADGRKIRYTARSAVPIPYDDVANFRPLKMKIADLGVAIWKSEAAEYQACELQSPSLRAPEVYIGAGWDSKIDIWTLGLLVLEMLRGSPVIPIQKDATVLESNVFILVQRFGKFPPDFLAKGKFSSRYFKPDGSFLYDMPEEVAACFTPWVDILQPYERLLHPDEIRNMTSFLELSLRLRPEERATAAQLLDHVWINSETLLLEE